MKLTIQREYLHTYVPLRCRKARQEKRVADIDIEIKEVRGEEARIAVVSRDRLGDWPYLRWYAGRFWQPTGESASDENIDDVLGRLYTRNRDLEEVVSMFRDECDRVLIVDGYLYHATGEPVFVVDCFGFGRGAGTALSVRSIESVMRNLPNQAFGFCEIGTAVRMAVETAESREDYDSVPTLKAVQEEYEVLVPDAFAFRGMGYRVKLVQDKIDFLKAEMAERGKRVTSLEKEIDEIKSRWSEEGMHVCGQD